VVRERGNRNSTIVLSSEKFKVSLNYWGGKLSILF
jgi:hypothetical protein